MSPLSYKVSNLYFSIRCWTYNSDLHTPVLWNLSLFIIIYKSYDTPLIQYQSKILWHSIKHYLKTLPAHNHLTEVLFTNLKEMFVHECSSHPKFEHVQHISQTSPHQLQFRNYSKFPLRHNIWCMHLSQKMWHAENETLADHT